jgi:hypothetical protein
VAEGTLTNSTTDTTDTTDADAAAGAFIARWQASGSAERANYGLFLTGGWNGAGRVERGRS